MKKSEALKQELDALSAYIDSLNNRHDVMIEHYRNDNEKGVVVALNMAINTCNEYADKLQQMRRRVTGNYERGDE